MKIVRLPSGIPVNLDQMTLFDPASGTMSFGHPDMDTAFVGDDLAMLREYFAKRPLLIPPPRGKKAP